MREIRVLICEFSGALHANLKSNFSEAFKRAGYRADIRISDDIDEAVRSLANHDYEVLITDLSFNEHINVGLNFIKSVKQDYPDLCVAACSSSAPNHDDTRTTRPTFDVFIPKRSILSPTEEDLDVIANDIQNVIPRLSGFILNVVGGSITDLRVSGEPISERDVRSLVGQVLKDLRATSEPFQPRSVTLEPITGGYSGSLVMQATLHAEDPNLTFVKTVMKFSKLDWATDEAQNFKRYAKWMLPFNKRVELVGEGQTKKFGAVAYAFVFGGETTVANLTEKIENKDDEALRRYLDVIFDDELINFYNATTLKSEVSAGQHYRARYFPDQRIQENEEKFNNTATALFGATKEANNFLISGETFPDPFRVIFSGLEKRFSLAVCHGDFNSNNIICADRDRVAYIDFQDTGPGHILQDFAALEHSVRLNWAPKVRSRAKNWPVNLLKTEKAISLGSVPRRKQSSYELMCLEIRNMAMKKFPDLQDWEYPFAIGALALKLLRIGGLNNIQLSRLTACALVATQYLENR